MSGHVAVPDAALEEVVSWAIEIQAEVKISWPCEMVSEKANWLVLVSGTFLTQRPSLAGWQADVRACLATHNAFNY